MTDAPVPNLESGGVGGAAGSVEPATPAPQPSPAPALQHPAEIPSLIGSLTAPTGAPVPAPEAKETVAAPAEAPAVATETKVAEPAPAEAPKPADAAPPVSEVQAPVVVDAASLKLPEGFTAKPERLGEFATLFNDRNIPEPEKAQKYLDMHAAAMRAFGEAIQKKAQDDQFSTWTGMRSTWVKEIIGDPELGGAAFETNKTAVARMRDMFVSREPYGSAKWQRDHDAFTRMCQTTGAGDTRALFLLLHNVARVFDEGSPPPPNPRPPPDLGKNPNAKGGLRQLYTSKAANGAAR